MVYRTFGDLRSQVERELDTEDEEFTSQIEMQQYFNSAITLCEATIVKLGLREKYLQAESFISTIAGQSDYALPNDITLTKIRKLVYRNETLIYTMSPLRSEGAYAYEDLANINPSSECYNWSLYKSGASYMLRLSPKAYLSVTDAIRVIYFKSLNRYATETTLCDLPDICYEYLLSYVRYRVYAKLNAGSPNAQDEKQNMMALLVLMTETMQNQIADPDVDLIDGDFSHYQEMN